MMGDEIRFGPFRLDLRRREVRREDKPVRLGARALDILCELASAGGNIVSKDDLLARLWAGRIVEEGNVPVHVSALRRALDDQGDGHCYIVTVPGRGYRLAGLNAFPSEKLNEPPSAQNPPPSGKSSVAPVQDKMGKSSSALDENPSIAVLSFRNLSGDPGREYFADGLVEDIVTTLSRIPRLVVIPRSSSYLYKGRSVDVRQVGDELGARYVLDGSIQVAGSKLRVSCELIDATSGRQLWVDRYDGAMEDVFEVQDKITSSIVASLSSKVHGAEITRAQAKPTDNLSARDLCLRAIAKLGPDRTESSVNEAVELLHCAIAADRQFSSAYGFLASAYWTRIVDGWGSIDDAKTLGYAAAKLAVELAKDEPIALYLGGFGLAYLGGRLEEGLAHIERALTLNPTSLPAWRLRGFVCSMMGDHEKSIQYFERSLQLDPRDTNAFEAYSGISLSHFFLRHYNQAILWAERALREKPRFIRALMFKMGALAMDGSDPDELRDIVQRLKSLWPDKSLTTLSSRLAVYRTADRELFETALRKAKAGFPD
jgi:TolB-like protein